MYIDCFDFEWQGEPGLFKLSTMQFIKTYHSPLIASLRVSMSTFRGTIFVITYVICISRLLQIDTFKICAEISLQVITSRASTSWMGEDTT